MTAPLLPVTPRVLADIALEIDPAEVLRFQGYKQGRDTPGPDVLALFDEALALGRRLMEPCAVVQWVGVTRRAQDELEAGGVTLTIPQIGVSWGEVEWIVAAVCTIGGEVERRVAELWEARELPLAAMLDSVGSGAAESLAEYVNDVLCQEGLRRGVRVTNRISPGYGGWDVSQQAELFRLCTAEAIGVALNEALFMTPVKSISLLVGAGAAARVDHYFSQCARCWMRDCAYRRTPAGTTVRR